MLSLFPRGVLDEILNLIESASEGFPSYSCTDLTDNTYLSGELSLEIYSGLRVLGRFLPGESLFTDVV